MIKHIYQLVVLCTLAAIFGSACGKDFTQTNEVQLFEHPSCEEVVFDSGGQSVDAVLCLPAGPRINLPGVVFLHGSGAYEPPPPEVIPDVNDAMPFTIQEELAEHGFAALSILYFSRTPSPGPIPNTFIEAPLQAMVEARPIWIESIEDGLKYLKTRPEVDPDRIGLVGYSLGASLALALDQTRNDHAALVLISGEVWMDQDLTQLTAGDASTLILYGNEDIVPISETQRIQNALEANDIKHEVVEIEGADHTWVGQAGDEGFTAVVDFLNTYLVIP